MAALVPDLPKVEQHIVEMTNQVRHEQKLSDPEAQRHAGESGARLCRDAWHEAASFPTPPMAATPAQRAENAGYKFCDIAENLAMDRDSKGFDTGDLAIQAIAGWMNSPPHRANIMMSSATEIGVGVARAPGPEPKFISVELFGRPAAEICEIRNRQFIACGRQLHVRRQDARFEAALSVVQSSCTPGELVFSTPGGLFSSASEIARLPAQDGKLYTLKSGATGGVTVDVAARGKGR